jgi:hypothetical protein
MERAANLIFDRFICIPSSQLDGELPSDSNPTLQPIASLPSLALSGNSTSLACWDTKFGFSPRPFIASLKSLSPDGGKVPLMDIKIVKCFPIAYRDILSVGGGPGAAGAGGGGGGGGEGKTAMGSDIRSKKDEMALRDAWNVCLSLTFLSFRSRMLFGTHPDRL